MAVNPAIALGVKGLEVPDPLAQYSRVMAIQSAQQQNALAQRQMQQAEQQAEQQNRLRQFLPTMTSENRNQLLQYGEGGRQAYESLIKGEKEAREGEKAAAEVAAKRMQEARDLLPSVQSPEAYTNWRTYTLQNLPGLVSVIPEQYSPAAVQNLMLKADQALEQHFVSQGLGGRARVLAIPKYAQGPAQVVPGSEAAVSMAPGEADRINIDRQRLALESRRVGLAEQEGQIRQQGLEGLAPKEVQKREAAFPQATSAVKGFEAKSESFIKDLQKLRDHPGLSQITGFIAGRAPALTADGRAAQALYDKVVAKGGFQALQDMRDASKSGGALGSVSNQEGKQLIASFSAIDRRQDARDVQAAIDQSIADVEGARTRMREAYDSTYSYKRPAAEPAAGGVIDFGSLK
jgi:hypothetical protein